MIRGLVLAVLAAVGPAVADDRARPDIRDLTCVTTGGRVVVSYRLEHAWGERQLERLQAGVPVVFRHQVDLRLRRGMLLPDRVPARTVVETRVTFDALTRRYDATRRVEVRRAAGGAPADAVEERRSFDGLDGVREFSTTVRDVALYVAPDILAERAATVRVESDLGRRWAWYLFPTSIDVAERCELSGP